MLRKLHSIPGLFAALFLTVLAITGAILSVSPALERSSAVIPASGEVSVAQVVERVTAHYPGTEQIKRSPSGAVIVYYTLEGNPGADLVNPITGEGIGPYQPSPFFRWVKDLHRAFLQDDGGRLLAGAMAFMMVLMCVSGAFMLSRRVGGWRFLLKPFKGAGDHRIHSELARFAAIGLLLSALTGSYMSAARFGLLPDAAGNEPSFPAEVSGGEPAPIGSLEALKNTDLNNLRELVFPYPNDPRDVFSLTTRQGSGFIDQSTGQFLKYQATPAKSRMVEWIVRLHTGEGLWWLGLIVGAAALTVPVLSVTGARIWWLRRRASGNLQDNADNDTADTVILVGSENNTTWGFARVLHEQLTGAGRRVVSVDMNRFAEEYPLASILFVLTSTYGDGGAPASANGFMERLRRFRETRGLKYAVLGFGDRQFPRFCQFAVDVDEALGYHGLERLEEVTLIDRQSAEQFSEWGDRIADLTGVPLTLNYHPEPVSRFDLELVDRADFGLDIGAPTSILRFGPATKKRSALGLFGKRVCRLPDFEAGDLVGVFPPGDKPARYYSLASSSDDGLLEICVRKQPGGLCSGFLHDLGPGERIQGFIQHNPDFRPASGNQPIILIGAGAGIGPLAGFIRKNNSRHPMYLYWGGRNPQSDFLYKPELGRYLEDQRLTRLNTAFSRTRESAYVQDKIIEDAPDVRQMIEMGAQILVCGGRDMALGVKQVINEILKPLEMDVENLKREGRYLEDVY
ncbi:PepSY domain-containing protein [Marinobacter sediminum]|uniref:PepSY domain-containing protein n=1 Tax=Marinobacter sediminum TaxID=256323 RepID=UPI00202E2F50|nr:PepSY domain-containing protein [Marinobacter sediminum]MCM0612101.1 PepSY domain-containing protein [Marinobacter sediminum]